MGASSLHGVIDISLTLGDLCRISTALGLLYRDIEDHPDKYPISAGKQRELDDLRNTINATIVEAWTEE